MNWLQHETPEANATSPFDAAWHTDLQPVAPNGGYDARLEQLVLSPVDIRATTYAILDGACIPDLPERLPETGLAHACLFQGKSAEDLHTASPWLVALDRNHAFSRSLFTDSAAPWHLWKSEGVLLFQASLSLADMRRHLRRFTRIRHTDGDWYFFRFWQADIMGALALSGPLAWSRSSLPRRGS